MPNDPDQRPTPPVQNYSNGIQSKPNKLKRFGFGGFCFLVALVCFCIQQGCSMLSPDPSWIAALLWFSVVTIMIVMGIWLWDQTAKRHWVIRGGLSVVAVLLMALLSYPAIKRQYIAEHPDQKTQAVAITNQSGQTTTSPINQSPQPISLQQVAHRTDRKQAPPSPPTVAAVPRGNNPDNSGFTFLKNEGTIDKAQINDLTVKGTPAPNSQEQIVHVAPGAKIGTLHMERPNVYMMPSEVAIPQPSVSGANFHTRIEELKHKMNTWEETADAADPKTMKEFHETFGPEIMLIAEQLRECKFAEIARIYAREQDRVDSLGMVGMTSTDLWAVYNALPKNEEHIECANK